MGQFRVSDTMNGPLGKNVPYSDTVDESLLHPIERGASRARLRIREPLPFEGFDRWTAYEVSWLDERGIPQVGIARIVYPASSPMIVESKSLKLFLGGFNFTKFQSVRGIEGAIQGSLARSIDCDSVSVRISTHEEWASLGIEAPPGVCVDRTPIESTQNFKLRTHDEVVEETLHSNLLRSLCPVTAQPDWGTVVIHYRGRKLDPSSLVGYLLTHRSHQGFHEECCEMIFSDLVAACSPTSLWVGCMYTRRGGIDINPERWIPGTKRLEIRGRFARQ
jgi:7-cyano-7-deazaguanine reductase